MILKKIIKIISLSLIPTLPLAFPIANAKPTTNEIKTDLKKSDIFYIENGFITGLTDAGLQQETIIIPDYYDKDQKVIGIEQRVFENDLFLKNVILGKNTCFVKENAFHNCFNINSIIVNNVNCEFEKFSLDTKNTFMLLISEDVTYWVENGKKNLAIIDNELSAGEFVCGQKQNTYFDNNYEDDKKYGDNQFYDYGQTRYDAKNSVKKLNKSSFSSEDEFATYDEFIKSKTSRPLIKSSSKKAAELQRKIDSYEVADFTNRSTEKKWYQLVNFAHWEGKWDLWQTKIAFYWFDTYTYYGNVRTIKSVNGIAKKWLVESNVIHRTRGGSYSDRNSAAYFDHYADRDGLGGKTKRYKCDLNWAEKYLNNDGSECKSIIEHTTWWEVRTDRGGWHYEDLEPHQHRIGNDRIQNGGEPYFYE